MITVRVKFHYKQLKNDKELRYDEIQVFGHTYGSNENILAKVVCGATSAIVQGVVRMLDESTCEVINKKGEFRITIGSKFPPKDHMVIDTILFQLDSLAKSYSGFFKEFEYVELHEK